MPQVRRLFLDSAFDADTVKMMGEVFEAAWRMVEPAFNLQPQATIDDGRATLAKAIIHFVSQGMLNTDVLTDEAIRAVKLTNPSLPF